MEKKRRKFRISLDLVDGMSEGDANGGFVEVVNQLTVPQKKMLHVKVTSYCCYCYC